jgi:hypothetical protein
MSTGVRVGSPDALARLGALVEVASLPAGDYTAG